MANKTKSQKAVEKELDKPVTCEGDEACVDPNCEVMEAPVQPPQVAQGMRAMSEEDINAYMTSLMKSQQPPPHLSTVEIAALGQYRGAVQQQGNAENQLTRAQSEVERTKAMISRLQGQSEAFVNILVLAEDTRRAEK